MNKRSDTPWQQWAQAYMAKYESDTGVPPNSHMDAEDASRYSHAAWEACKTRTLQILRGHVGAVNVDPQEAHINLDAIQDIEAL